MKLRNRKTGEIVEFRYLQSDHVAPLVLTTYENDKPEMYTYNSLTELSAEWEDVPEEPKKRHYYIDPRGQVIKLEFGDDIDELKEELSEIGNYFDSREEAEKAVEKLKAWKRLKSGGFEFMSCSYGHDKTTDDTGGWIRFRVNHLYDDRYGCKVEKDLDLLLRGEE